MTKNKFECIKVILKIIYFMVVLDYLCQFLVQFPHQYKIFFSLYLRKCIFIYHICNAVPQFSLLNWAIETVFFPSFNNLFSIIESMSANVSLSTWGSCGSVLA